MTCLVKTNIVMSILFSLVRIKTSVQTIQSHVFDAHSAEWDGGLISPIQANPNTDSTFMSSHEGKAGDVSSMTV